MPRKDKLDGFGVGALLSVQFLFAFNQIIVKTVNEGLQPVFFAGLRSALAVLFVALWLWFKGRPPRLERAALGAGVLMGGLFAAEFLFLFLALDLTTVGRTSVIFYSMPVWLAIMAHFGLVGERITPLKALGLMLAFLGTAWAILGRSADGAGSLVGDLCALGAAFGWAATAFMARKPTMAKVGPEMQLFWMVLVSAPILLLASPLFGPLIRDLQPVHIWWLIFQASVVVAGGFIAWLWLLAAYPSATVASFSFLTPIFGLSLGAIVFSEPLTVAMLGSAALVAVGIILINRKQSGAR
jgi:drug/metabolite transporter (DMT)-like permease